MPESLYGNAAGDWAFVESSPGLILAPQFGDLRYLCAPDEAIPRLYGLIPRSASRRGPTASYPAQQMLADLAGVGQQAISRYLREQSRPVLADDGWRRVCALLYAWTEWPDKPCDLPAVREFLATGDAIRARRKACPKAPGARLLR